MEQKPPLNYWMEWRECDREAGNDFEQKNRGSRSSYFPVQNACSKERFKAR